MSHLDIAYVGPGLTVPTWTPDDNDFATIYFSPAPGASTVSATNPAYSGYYDDGHDPAVTHWTVAIDERVPDGRRLRLEAAQMHQTNDFPDGVLKWCNLVAKIDEL